MAFLDVLIKNSTYVEIFLQKKYVFGICLQKQYACGDTHHFYSLQQPEQNSNPTQNPIGLTIQQNGILIQQKVTINQKRCQNFTQNLNLITIFSSNLPTSSDQCDLRGIFTILSFYRNFIFSCLAQKLGPKNQQYEIFEGNQWGEEKEDGGERVLILMEREAGVIKRAMKNQQRRDSSESKKRLWKAVSTLNSDRMGKQKTLNQCCISFSSNAQTFFAQNFPSHIPTSSTSSQNITPLTLMGVNQKPIQQFKQQELSEQFATLFLMNQFQQQKLDQQNQQTVIIKKQHYIKMRTILLSISSILLQCREQLQILKSELLGYNQINIIDAMQKYSDGQISKEERSKLEQKIGQDFQLNRIIEKLKEDLKIMDQAMGQRQDKIMEMRKLNQGLVEQNRELRKYILEMQRQIEKQKEKQRQDIEDRHKKMQSDTKNKQAYQYFQRSSTSRDSRAKLLTKKQHNLKTQQQEQTQKTPSPNKKPNKPKPNFTDRMKMHKNAYLKQLRNNRPNTEKNPNEEGQNTNNPKYSSNHQSRVSYIPLSSQNISSLQHTPKNMKKMHTNSIGHINTIHTGSSSVNRRINDNSNNKSINKTLSLDCKFRKISQKLSEVRQQLQNDLLSMKRSNLDNKNQYNK